MPFAAERAVIVVIVVVVVAGLVMRLILVSVINYRSPN